MCLWLWLEQTLWAGNTAVKFDFSIDRHSSASEVMYSVNLESTATAPWLVVPAALPSTEGRFAKTSQSGAIEVQAQRK